jgi:hypothetical protein
MSNKQRSNAFTPMGTILYGSAGVLSAALIAGAAVTLLPRQAKATPAYAAQTKLACGACHTNPPSAANLTDRGKDFQKNHK